jgi:lipopolysaccharide/colanic/teichoic acid biosynthesis glycosyltransferase
MRAYGALAADLCWVAITPFVALLIRDNLSFDLPHWEALAPYAAISSITCLAAIMVAGSHKMLWQYTSLPDVLKIVAVVTVGLMLAVSICFVGSRLEGVARSVPVIHWFVLIGAIVGMRVGFRIWHERTHTYAPARSETLVQNVLVVGEGPLTELYLRSVAAYGSRAVGIVGILSERSRGQRLRQQEVLGRPEELREVIDRLEVHGIEVRRIVVTQPLETFSSRAAEVLLALERGSSVKVDWIVERLGLALEPMNADERALHPALKDDHPGLASQALAQPTTLSRVKYRYLKRAFDLLTALFLSAILAPLILGTVLLVCLDVGLPIVFWQQRPGRFGRPFKLFKFRTMGPPNDPNGNRISEEQRSSSIGRLLRKTRLDELPQLYNILIGDMSFVGPRPLLQIDQPENMSSRLSVRPGLTGFAQVNGGRRVSIEDKNALDMWYVRNASLWLDIKILLSTPLVLIRGERVDEATLHAVRGPEPLAAPASLADRRGIADEEMKALGSAAA